MIFFRPLALTALLLLVGAPARAQVPRAPTDATAGPARKPATPVVNAPRKANRPAPGPAAAEQPPAPPPQPPQAGEAAASADAADPAKGTITGLPLPRWASFRNDEVNLRAGPGTRYPIEWVYKRRDLPVRILREFDVWRLVEDSDGIKGWVHQATLVGRHDFIVSGGERTLRAAAQVDAPAVALLKPGVIGRIRACEENSPWCEVQVAEYRGWLRRDEFWGVSAGEAVP